MSGTLPIVDDLMPLFLARIGVDDLAGAELARAEAALTDARELVTAAAGTALSDPPQPVTITITLTAARRAYLNPTGAESETVGPYSVRYSEDSVNGVYLTDAELRALHGLAGPRGLWIQPTYRDEPDGTFWVYDQDGDNGGDPIAFETIDEREPSP
jgi:hypothetical protein